MNFSPIYLLDLSRKTIRFTQYLKYYSYSVIRKKIADYPAPPNTLKNIGCFDRKMLIRTSKKYKRYFDPNNLSDISEDTIPYKENKITLILDGVNVLIKKSFTSDRNFNNFYSELICYSEIGHLDITPKVKYVNYEESIIYMEYIDGVGLAAFRKNISEIARNNQKIIYDGFLKISKLLHNHGIIFGDMSNSNFVMKGDRIYIFDFSDAIYFSKGLLSLKPVKKAFQKLVDQENNKVITSLKNLGIE